MPPAAKPATWSRAPAGDSSTHLDRRGLGQLAPLVSANYKRWLWLLVRRNPFTRRVLMMATVAAASAAVFMVLALIVVGVFLF